jgi:hypothetical protein
LVACAAQTNGSRQVDFFISYTQSDRNWAEWIAWELEKTGYTTLIQAWDFAVGSNWAAAMDRAVANARRLIAVLSDAYLGPGYGHVRAGSEAVSGRPWGG